MAKIADKKIAVETQSVATGIKMVLGVVGMMFAASAAIATILTVYVFS